jgi:hypothetical protein
MPKRNLKEELLLIFGLFLVTLREQGIYIQIFGKDTK